MTQLHQVGALDSAGFVTLLGKQMAGFPMLNPSVTRMLAEAASRCVKTNVIDAGCSA